MPPPSINIQPPAYAKGLFRRLRVIRIRHRQLATEDQMRRETGVLVWRVVGVSVIAEQRKHKSTLVFLLLVPAWPRGNAITCRSNLRSVRPREDVVEAP